MSKMMTSQADTELSMLANTKYKRCCLRKGLQERKHFALHWLGESYRGWIKMKNNRSATVYIGCFILRCFLTILFLPRRSWKTRRKPGSPRLQSGWSRSSAACPERAGKAEKNQDKYTPNLCQSQYLLQTLMLNCCSNDTPFHQISKQQGSGLPLVWRWRQGQWRQLFHMTSCQKPGYKQDKWASVLRRQCLIK